MIIVISGSRTITDPSWVSDCLNAELSRLMLAGEAEFSFRVGDAKGVDALAAAWCSMLAFKYLRHEANWAAHSTAAEALRNWEMVKGPPRADLLLALWDGSSPGTRNCIASALNQQVESRVCIAGGPPDLWLSGSEAIRRANKALLASAAI